MTEQTKKKEKAQEDTQHQSQLHYVQEQSGQVVEKVRSVLDLFGGSGSTLIVCEQLNKKCYMMELDPHYIDVIIQRWENFTGDKAVLIERKEN